MALRAAPCRHPGKAPCPFVHLSVCRREQAKAGSEGCGEARFVSRNRIFLLKDILVFFVFKKPVQNFLVSGWNEEHTVGFAASRFMIREEGAPSKLPKADAGLCAGRVGPWHGPVVRPRGTAACDDPSGIRECALHPCPASAAEVPVKDVCDGISFMTANGASILSVPGWHGLFIHTHRRVSNRVELYHD